MVPANRAGLCGRVTKIGRMKTPTGRTERAVLAALWRNRGELDAAALARLLAKLDALTTAGAATNGEAAGRLLSRHRA